MFIKRMPRWLALVCFLIICAPWTQARGEELIKPEEMPEYERRWGVETHLPVRVTVNKSIILKIEHAAATVSVDRPEIAAAMMDGAKKIKILARRNPGVAHITLKDAQGKVVMARYVVVAPVGVRYVKMYHACLKEAADRLCGQKRAFFCPRQCFEFRLVKPAPIREEEE